MASNYFEIFSLDTSFDLDDKALERSYFDLVRKYHPDKFSDETQKKLAYQNTITINNAYKIISNEVTRAEYILSLHNIAVGTENDDIKPEQNFLIDLIEVEEALSSARDLVELQEMLKREKSNYHEYITSFKNFLANSDYISAAQNSIKMRYTQKLIQKIENKLDK